MRKTIGDGPKWAVGTEARSKDIRSGSPGPGQYEMRQSREGPQWVMGTSKRTEYKGTDAPGPGGHEVKGALEGPQYSIAGKAVEVRREGAPGPGQYELRVESGPGVKIGKDSKESKDMTTRREVPGPGQYDQGNKGEGPAYGFGSAQRE